MTHEKLLLVLQKVLHKYKILLCLQKLVHLGFVEALEELFGKCRLFRYEYYSFIRLLVLALEEAVEYLFR